MGDPAQYQLGFEFCLDVLYKTVLEGRQFLPFGGFLSGGTESQPIPPFLELVEE